MKSVQLLLVLLLAAIPTTHAGTATGRVTSLLVNNNSNAVLFSIGGGIEGSPRCNSRGVFAIDLTQIGGDALYRLLLDAKQVGYVISVTGLNTCSVHVEAESVKTVELN